MFKIIVTPLKGDVFYCAINLNSGLNYTGKPDFALNVLRHKGLYLHTLLFHLCFDHCANHSRRYLLSLAMIHHQLPLCRKILDS